MRFPVKKLMFSPALSREEKFRQRSEALAKATLEVLREAGLKRLEAEKAQKAA